MSEDFRISVDLVQQGTRLRAVDGAQVDAIKASILDVGLLNPITVYRRKVIDRGISVDGYGVVAGAHRLEAYRQIGYDEIPARVVEMSELERQLAECDENLCRHELTPSDRARFTARRKQAYEALHPETRNGVSGNGREKPRQVGEATSDSEYNPVDRFTADTAAKSGRSERAVQRDAERGEKVIPEAMQMVSGTKLDTGTYLDKLKRLSPNEQVHAVKRDLAQAKRDDEERAERGGIAGRIKQAAAEPPPPTFDEIAGMLDRLWKLSVEDFIRICPPQKRAAMCQRMSRLQTVFEKVAEEVVS